MRATRVTRRPSPAGRPEGHCPRAQARLARAHRPAPARAGKAYGYEIVSKLTAETNGALEVTDGTLYPGALRLERAGFVDRALGDAGARRAAEVLPADRAGHDELARLTAGVDHVRAGDGQLLSEGGETHDDR